MIVLAFLAIKGKGLSMIPMPKRITPSLDVKHSRSVYVLGLFSGAATSCCAPVLAGAITLAIVSASFWQALLVTFLYVLGMVFPLIFAAYFYDRFHLEESRIIRGKMLEIKLGKHTTYIHSTNLIAAAIFLAMGIILLTLAISGNAFWAPSFQGTVSNHLNHWSQDFSGWIDNFGK